jgi:hypothetical protein
MSAEDCNAVSSPLTHESPPHLTTPAHPVPSKTSPTLEEAANSPFDRLMSPTVTDPVMKLRKAYAISLEPENPSLAGLGTYTALPFPSSNMRYERHSYQAWSFAFLNNVRGARFRGHLTNPGNCPTTEEVEADADTGPLREIWLSNDDVVISRIMSSVSRTEIPYIQDCMTAYEIWTALDRRHKRWRTCRDRIRHPFHPCRIHSQHYVYRS